MAENAELTGSEIALATAALQMVAEKGRLRIPFKLEMDPRNYGTEYAWCVTGATHNGSPFLFGSTAADALAFALKWLTMEIAITAEADAACDAVHAAEDAARDQPSFQAAAE